MHGYKWPIHCTRTRTELVHAGALHPTTLRMLEDVGGDLARQLGMIGSHSTGLLAQNLMDGGAGAAASESTLVAALVRLLHTVYCAFVSARPQIDHSISTAMTGAAQVRCGAAQLIHVASHQLSCLSLSGLLVPCIRCYIQC